MFNIGDIIEQAKGYLGEAGVTPAANAIDLGQLLEGVGLDADALAQLTPEEALSLMENTGLDAELLSRLKADGTLQCLLSAEPAQ